MNYLLNFTLTLLFSLSPSIIFCQEYQYNINDGDLIIINQESGKNLIFKDIKSFTNIQIKLPLLRSKNKDAEENPPKQAEEDSEKQELNSELEQVDNRDSEKQALVEGFILQANEHYNFGENKKAWEVLNRAELLDSANAQIKAMKGSLLLQTGDKESAIKYWEESLKINPDQQNLRMELERLKK